VRNRAQGVSAIAQRTGGPELVVAPGAAVPSPAMTTAQVLFSIALGAIALFIAVYAVYVAGSTMWGDRWFRRGPR
jgi:type IV secretory pathway VirB2 component (pilin)